MIDDKIKVMQTKIQVKTEVLFISKLQNAIKSGS